MPARLTWLVDMGDGTWAVSCSRCELFLFRGALRHANRVYREHSCPSAIVAARRFRVRGGRR
jgi:hypothetical protein